MNNKLNRDKIRERCGNVSFKKGETYFRKGKVEIVADTAADCRAIVHASEDFEVHIEKDASDNLQANCTCPTLASVHTDCQHIAAVLLALSQKQAKSAAADLSEGLRDIFQKKPKQRQAKQQLRFEDRAVLEIAFSCQPVLADDDQMFLQLMLWAGEEKVLVTDVMAFLLRIRYGESYALSSGLTYEPSAQYFESNTAAVLEQLTDMVLDTNRTSSTSIQIAPAYWQRIAPLLTQVPLLSIEGKDGLQLLHEKPPLVFHFTENKAGYILAIKGMPAVTLLAPYQAVLAGNTIYQLEREESAQLVALKAMLAGTDRIEFPAEQLHDYLENIAPNLRKIGRVEVDQTVSNTLRKTQLVAKLYLDRVKDRLLAGLEFHYGRILFNPLEQDTLQGGTPLLRDMEKETAILKLMKDSQFTITDSGYFLHNEELEYDFLHYQLPELQKLVQVHATTAVRNRVLTGPFQPKLRVQIIKKERTDWLEFKFDMASIPETEIKAILSSLEEKRKYYRLRNGSLLSLETREFAKLSRFLDGMDIQAEDLIYGVDVPIPRGLRLLDTGEDLFAFEASFHAFLEALRHPEKLYIPIPTAFVSILRDYQKAGFRWLKTLAAYGFGGILADDMGLGKTVQAISFIASELEAIRQTGRPALIVCPASLTYNWLKEIERFAPDMQALVLDGQPAERMQKRKALADVDVLITSYPLLLKDSRWYEKQTFHTIFFDEAQSFKNPATRTAKAVKKLQASNRFALTGTPIENALEELWSIFHVVFPELFGSLKDYSNLTHKQIARRVQPFILRRVKADVLAELPKKVETTEFSELLPEQKRLYGAYLAKLRHDTLKHLDKDTLRKNKIRILAGITRLRQICCHPTLFVDGYKGSSAKFEQLLEILETAMDSGRRVLLFSQYTKMLDLIGNNLAQQGLSFFYLDGETPPAERLDLCNRFNDGEKSIFLISLKAGGTGLNLTGADTVILYDNWWNPAVEAQAADRAHRMGQKREVQVIKLIARGTIEEKMNELQEKKRTLVESVVEQPADRAFALTEDDIQWLLGE